MYTLTNLCSLTAAQHDCLGQLMQFCLRDATPDVARRDASGQAASAQPFIEPQALAEQAEKIKASIRAKVEHPFRVLKRQFGYAKVRYRGLAKNTAQIVTLFALSNLWMARRQLMGARG